MSSNEVDPVQNRQDEVVAVQPKAKSKPKSVKAEVDIKKLLEAGAHFGHKTSRWHPKMAPYIHSKREGIYIIDLTKTVSALETALEFIEKTIELDKQILIVGTKRQSREIAVKLAEDTKMPYVTERWLGGMLTNKSTIGNRVKYLKELEAKLETGQLASKYNKLEMQRFQEEIDEMNHIYGGIKTMAVRPGALFVFDVITDRNAVKEAIKLGIPVVGLTDTNADPSDIMFPIPANDDAIKTLQLIADYVNTAIMAGKAKQKKVEDK